MFSATNQRRIRFGRHASAIRYARRYLAGTGRAHRRRDARIGRECGTAGRRSTASSAAGLSRGLLTLLRTKERCSWMSCGATAMCLSALVRSWAAQTARRLHRVLAQMRPHHNDPLRDAVFKLSRLSRRHDTSLRVRKASRPVARRVAELRAPRAEGGAPQRAAERSSTALVARRGSGCGFSRMIATSLRRSVAVRCVGRDRRRLSDDCGDRGELRMRNAYELSSMATPGAATPTRICRAMKASGSLRSATTVHAGMLRHEAQRALHGVDLVVTPVSSTRRGGLPFALAVSRLRPRDPFEELGQRHASARCSRARLCPARPSAVLFCVPGRALDALGLACTTACSVRRCDPRRLEDKGEVVHLRGYAILARTPAAGTAIALRRPRLLKRLRSSRDQVRAARE